MSRRTCACPYTPFRGEVLGSKIGVQGPTPFGLPHDRHIGGIELIALIIGNPDGRRMKNLVVGVTSYVGRRALDHLLADAEANHPAFSAHPNSPLPCQLSP